MTKRKIAIAVSLIVVVLFAGACAYSDTVSNRNTPTNAPAPTNTPIPTETPAPTNTPVPTEIPTPTPILNARISELMENAKDLSIIDNTTSELLTSIEAVDEYIYEKTKSQDYLKFSVFVSGADLLRPEEEYLSFWPGLTEVKYDADRVAIYKNGIEFKIEFNRVSGLHECDYAIYCTMENNDSSRLTEEELVLYEEIKKVAASCKASTEYETVKKVYDYLILNAAYDERIFHAPETHTSYGALIDKICVCDGYANAFLLILKELGIESIGISGFAGIGEDTGRHKWNKVKIDDEWCNIDVTWGDPTPDKPGQVFYEYFGLTDEELSKNHTWDNENLPKAESDTYNYLYQLYKDVPRVNGADALIAYLQDAMLKRKSKITVIDVEGDLTTCETVWQYFLENHKDYSLSSAGYTTESIKYGTLYIYEVKYY